MGSNQTAMNPLIGNTRLLSEEQFVNLAKRPYNPFWLDQVGFSETDQTTLLLGFNSKIKIDELIRGGALIAGDIFRANVAVRIAANSTVTRTVTMEAEFCGASSYSQLNIRIRAPSDPSGYRTVNCTGLGKIVQAWMQEDPLVVGGTSSYRNFYISRNYTNLGSLWTVRQKWHLWREEKDAWAAHRGEIGRHKRVTKAEKNEGYSYVKGKLTRTRNMGDGDEDGENSGWNGKSSGWHGENNGWHGGKEGHDSHVVMGENFVDERDDREELYAAVRDAAERAARACNEAEKARNAMAARAAPYYSMGGESSVQPKPENDRFPYWGP